MRWDNLLADQDGAQTAVLPFFPGEAVVRQFNTPQFRGMTFYEVAAKSIINHVPGDRFGFNWTINPYRGCSHSCVYCLSGDTAILMGDGSLQALGDLRPGDAVVGSRVYEIDPAGRRPVTASYQRTTVLRRWPARKPGFRVVLADGTAVAASGDHRFLTWRGWRFVTGGPGHRRPALSAGDRLMGTGQASAWAPDTRDGDYQRGYLFGLLKAEGHRGVDGVVNLEGLRRGRRFLEALGIACQLAGAAAAGSGGNGRIVAPAGLASDLSVEPDSRSWCAGFLGGVVDAQSASPNRLRLRSGDPALLDWACHSLDRFGLSYERDPGGRAVVFGRGVRERLALVRAVDPAVSRIGAIEREPVPTGPGLEVVAIEPMGRELAMYDITTGTGNFIADGVVSHNCFARPTHTYLDFNGGKDFETRIVVKVNAADLLRRELRRPAWKGQLIAMGTNTDPYQRAEGHYRLMRGILTELNAARNPYSILTKGTLIQRDIDLLAEGAAVTEVAANLSVGTVDEAVWRKAEPGTPHPMKRLELVRMLNDAGIPTGVLMAPILPGISDHPEQLAATVKAAAEAGATHITPITLHLRPGVKEEFWPWLEATYPELVPDYEKNYRRSYARKEVSDRIGAQVGELRRRSGVIGRRTSGGGRASPGPPPDVAANPPPAGEAGAGGPAGEAGAGGAAGANETGGDEQLSLDLGADGPRRVPRGLKTR